MGKPLPELSARQRDGPQFPVAPLFLAIVAFMELSEIHREGTIILDSGHLLYFREDDQTSQGGVGFLVNRSLSNNIKEISSVSNRVAYLILRLSKRSPPSPPPPAACAAACVCTWACSSARSSISTGRDSFTELGLHDKKICTWNNSFTDHGFHDKHIKVEVFIWGVATKVYNRDVLLSYKQITATHVPQEEVPNP
ncbi:hypothetical protein MSG28_010422 [Choristoneura fumiferana]|uniref:Uncharacterized protein n=1 Tax=Choristoneura fumiferana TaxID=7141 RepID=A0ACC0KL77_CHOFU|nr:hypothetical protein MSG28_010422 [Choristoneura fumiferana]